MVIASLNIVNTLGLDWIDGPMTKSLSGGMGIEIISHLKYRA